MFILHTINNKYIPLYTILDSVTRNVLRSSISSNPITYLIFSLNTPRYTFYFFVKSMYLISPVVWVHGEYPLNINNIGTNYITNSLFIGYTNKIYGEFPTNTCIPTLEIWRDDVNTSNIKNSISIR